MKIVRVAWLDAGMESHNLSTEEAKKVKPMPRYNVGYLLEETDEKIVICFGAIVDADKDMSVWDCTLVIPKGIVTEMICLGEA